MSQEKQTLTHLDAEGRVKMVDVGHKPVSRRRAKARAVIRMSREAIQQVQQGSLIKGDVRAVARLAGIQAAKQTSLLIPLCHPLPLDHVELDLRVDPEENLIALEATVLCRAATGAEMEAIVAVSIAAATIYDMCKAVDKSMQIGEIELLEKSGGKSGDYRKST